MKWDESEQTINKSRSPNSLFFYLKKFENDLVLAEAGLAEYRKAQLGKLKRKSDKAYWIWKGFDEAVAEEMAREWMLSHNRRVCKIKRHNSPYATEISNLVKSGLTKEEAVDTANSRRRRVSPRLQEYWLARGYDSVRASELVSDFQSKNSPRTVFYWINSGSSYEEAISRVSDYQDNLSIEAIQSRLSCSREEAYDVQMEYIEKQKNSCDHIDDEYYGLFLLYKSKVNKHSNRSYAVFKEEIDPDNKRGRENHLDHIVSVKDGFVYNIPSEIIGSKHNLRIISLRDNCSKGAKSGATIESLIEKYNANKC
jgi:hypothetical protein